MLIGRAVGIMFSNRGPNCHLAVQEPAVTCKIQYYKNQLSLAILSDRGVAVAGNIKHKRGTSCHLQHSALKKLAIEEIVVISIFSLKKL